MRSEPRTVTVKIDVDTTDAQRTLRGLRRQVLNVLHAPDITEDDDGFFHAACTCGWTELAGHADRLIAVWHHRDHVEEVAGDGDED